MSFAAQVYVWFAFTFLTSVLVICSVYKPQYTFTWRDFMYFVLGAIWMFLKPNIPF